VGIETPVDPARLESRARVARGLLADPPGPVAPDLAVLDSLYDVLIAPAVRSGLLSGVQRLTIVPHSFLTYLPYAALRNPATRRYLVEDFTLAHLPSAAALPVLRRAPATEGAASREHPGVFAPMPAALPGTLREAKSVRASLRGTKLYLAGEATERQFRQALSSPAIVHLAGHGTMNPRNPMFSQVTLAVGSGNGPEDDGRLEVHEVLGLRVRSPLVFLSGCETGAGTEWSTGFARGEDYSTLAQAFLYAGAGKVVATLWRIRDEGGAAFAGRFYDRLRELAPAEALAAAQRQLLRGPRYAAPYYWAGYRISGGGDAPAAAHESGIVSVNRN